MSVDIAERIASGSFILTVGQTLSLIIGTIFSFVIARLLGPDNYGLLSISLTYPLMVSNLMDLGLGGVIARYVAEPGKDRPIYAWTGVLIRLSSSIVGGLAVYLLSDFFASLLARPDIAMFIKVLSIYSCCTSILSPLIAVFNGLGKYKLAASVNIVQYCVRGPLTIALVLMGTGVNGAVIAYSASYLLVSLIYMAIYTNIVKPVAFSTRILKEMIYLALPLYASSISDIALKPVVDSILARHVSNYELGNYAVALNSLMPLGALLGAISTAVLTSFPLISGDQALLRENARNIAVYSSAVFTAIGMCYLSVITPLVHILYGKSYADAPVYALLYSASQVIPVILGSLVIGNYLLTIKATLLGGIIGVIRSVSIAIFTYLWVPFHGVVGAALAALIGSTLSSLIGLILVYKATGLLINVVDSVRISLPSMISFTIAYMISTRFARLLISFLTGLITYMTLYLIISPFFVKKSVIMKIAELACKLEYIGWIIKPITRIYLKLVLRE